MSDDLHRGSRHGNATTKAMEAEASAARDLLLEGRLAEAAQRMANVLTADPTREDWVVLIDDILSKAPDPLALLDFSTPQVEVGQVAVQARALVHEGELTEALALLSQVSAARPEVPFLSWADAWLEARPEALGELEPDLLKRLAVSMKKRVQMVIDANGKAIDR